MAVQTRRPMAGPVLTAGDAARPGTLSYGMATPPPVPVAPNPTPPYTAPSPQTFTGTAPKPTPYGDFAGLDPATFAHSPDYQYLVDSQQKALQRGAAARGTLLTGGFQKELQKNAAGLAAGDYGNQFDRELKTYTTNRDTNAQNFGQSMDAYQGSLAGFGANTNAALGYGHLGLDAQQNQFGQNRIGALDQQDYQQQVNAYNTGTAQNAADAYAQSVALQRQAAPVGASPQQSPRLAQRKPLFGR